MTYSTITAVSTKQLLNDADYFLHAFNKSTDTFTFVKTNQSTLQQLAFVDGREKITVDDTCYQLKTDDIESQFLPNDSKASLRFIFHIGFCGSTLLANALGQQADKVLCYKEPQVLIELAQLKASQHLCYRDKAMWQKHLRFCLSQLNKTFSLAQTAVIKPSNWVNSLLPDIVKSGRDIRAVFVSMPIEDYLIAVFRGGQQRFQFIYQLRQHLVQVLPEYAALCQEIDISEDDILLQVGKTTAIVYLMQQQLFIQAKAQLSSEHHKAINYHQISTVPETSIKQVSQALQLGLETQEIQCAIAASFTKHAKDSSYDYNVNNQAEINQQVVDYYRFIFEQASLWYHSISNTSHIKIA
ncbi:hypothetical protein [Thalassotalea atypica]|uniref:hypothetical protein n=1 Tax=Thalassotalea atypica TaxID=2054316 RepID=UPI002572FA2B|nr:hypothetical protein [Thalassotalea atypica]